MQTLFNSSVRTNQRASIIFRMCLTLFTVAVLIFVTTAFACGKKCDDVCKDKTGAEKESCVQVCKDGEKAAFIAWAKDINGVFKSARPHIARLKPSLLSKWDAGTAITDKLILAVQESNEVDIARLVGDLIPVVEEVAAQFTDNVTVLTILALGNIGLHFFLNHLPPITPSMRDTATSQGLAVDTLVNFKAQPIWGCKYLPDKCGQ